MRCQRLPTIAVRVADLAPAGLIGRCMIGRVRHLPLIRRPKG